MLYFKYVAITQKCGRLKMFLVTEDGLSTWYHSSIARKHLGHYICVYYFSSPCHTHRSVTTSMSPLTAFGIAVYMAMRQQECLFSILHNHHQCQRQYQWGCRDFFISFLPVQLFIEAVFGEHAPPPSPFLPIQKRENNSAITDRAPSRKNSHHVNHPDCSK